MFVLGTPPAATGSGAEGNSDAARTAGPSGGVVLSTRLRETSAKKVIRKNKRRTGKINGLFQTWPSDSRLGGAKGRFNEETLIY